MRAYGVADQVTEYRPWLGLGVGAFAEARFGRGWVVRTEMSAITPVIRDEFLFHPDETVHRPSNLGYSLSISLGWGLR